MRPDLLKFLNSKDHHIEYFYISRLRGEPLEGFADRYFHSFEPRQLRLTLSFHQ